MLPRSLLVLASLVLFGCASNPGSSAAAASTTACEGERVATIENRLAIPIEVYTYTDPRGERRFLATVAARSRDMLTLPPGSSVTFRVLVQGNLTQPTQQQRLQVVVTEGCR